MMTVRTLSRLVGVLALSAAASAWTGCSSTPENENASGTNTNSEFREAPSTDGGADSMGGKIPGFQTVYFDYDSSDIREDARPALRSNADKLNAGGLGTVTVEGHCDERGSTEYNLALGERRADAVKQYLVDSGVSGAKLDTVSFGEAKAAVQGHDESAWKWNRRAEFVVRR
jgi:peptidoglycan-associated lipoprotein